MKLTGEKCPFLMAAAEEKGHYLSVNCQNNPAIGQRLGDKLEQNGASGSFIQTLRGLGYALKN